MKISAGHLKKSGEPVFLIPQGRYTCFLKAGTIGVQVKIAAPNVKYPDAYDMKALDIKLLAGLTPAEVIIEAVAEPAADAELEKKIDEKLESAKAPAAKEEKAAPKKEKKAEAKKPAPKKEKKAEAKPAEKPVEQKAEEKAPEAKAE
jgi:ribosomal protein S3